MLMCPRCVHSFQGGMERKTEAEAKRQRGQIKRLNCRRNEMLTESSFLIAGHQGMTIKEYLRSLPIYNRDRDAEITSEFSNWIWVEGRQNNVASCARQMSSSLTIFQTTHASWTTMQAEHSLLALLSKLLISVDYTSPEDSGIVMVWYSKAINLLHTKTWLDD